MTKKVIRRKKPLDYTEYTKDFGTMYHLVLDVESFDKKSIRFCSAHDKDKFLTINDFPIFFTPVDGFLMAIDYTIVYPKIYVRSYKPISDTYGMKRAFLQ